MTKPPKIILIILGIITSYFVVRIILSFLWSPDDIKIKEIQTQIEKDYPAHDWTGEEEPILSPDLDKMTDGKG